VFNFSDAENPETKTANKAHACTEYVIRGVFCGEKPKKRKISPKAGFGFIIIYYLPSFSVVSNLRQT
jgi:hypothetical protein